MPNSTPSQRAESFERFSTRELRTLVESREAVPHALIEFARRRPSELAPTLKRLVGESTHPIDVRVAAAVKMRQRPALASESALLEGVKSRSMAVKRRAAEALGHTGSREALAVLARLREPADAVAARSLRFARHLLAYRHGLEGHRLQPVAQPLRVDARQARTVPIERLTAAKWTRMAQELPEGELPFKASPSGHQLIECGGERLVLVFNAGIQTAARRRTLLAAPAVVAALLAWRESFRTWTLSEYILAHPTGDGRAQLVGARGTGRTLHLGSASLDGDNLDFSLQALSGSLLPALHLTGRIAGSQSAQVSLQAKVEQERRGRGNLPRTPKPAVD